MKALGRAIGKEHVAAYLAWGTPPTGIRVERAEERSDIVDALRAANPDATFEESKWSPFAITGGGAGGVDDLPGHKEGQWTGKEEGSQLVALALDAQPGERVLDACAGRRVADR